VDGGQDVGAVLGDGGDVAADGVPVAGDLLGAEAAGYLLLGLSGSQIAFCLVGRPSRRLRVMRRPGSIRIWCG
jgi:hypothetical protein